MILGGSHNKQDNIFLSVILDGKLGNMTGMFPLNWANIGITKVKLLIPTILYWILISKKNSL